MGHAPGKSRSPFARSITALLRNRLAAAGLFLVVIMSFFVTVAPWLSPDDPTEIRPWLGARPPGFQHPDCKSENTFSVGAQADTTQQILEAGEIRFAVEEGDSVTYRVVVRRGIIHRIMVVEGAVPMDTLDLSQFSGESYELLEEDRIGRKLPLVALNRGEAPPQGIFADGQRVIFIRLTQVSVPSVYDIRIEKNLVYSIDQDGESIDGIVLRGDTIKSITTGDRELVRFHWLGTDELGRDVLSRILYGGRISMLVGITATLVSLVIGVCYGAAAGYFGGRTDRFMMSIVDILYAIPFMFLVIILLVLFGRNIIILFVALGAVQWLTMARIVRGQILTLKEMEFIDAARVCGAQPITLIFRHLIPNCIGPIVIYATLTVPVVILEESFLAFIGLTVQYQGENLDSWGALIQQGMQALGAGGERHWLLVWPALAMATTLFGFNCFGDGLRDCLDPKTRRVG